MSQVEARQSPEIDNWGKHILRQVRLLVPRLEKLSPDSAYAHRASGVRIALLRIAARVEAGAYPADKPQVTRAGDLAYLEHLIRQSYALLEGAAREMLKGR